MKLKIIKSFILLALTIIVGVLILRTLSWLLLVSSEGSFAAAGILFLISLGATQIAVKKFNFLKSYKKLIISLSFVSLFLLPSVAVSGPFGLGIIALPLLYFFVDRKIHAPKPTLLEITRASHISPKKKGHIKKINKLKYIIDSENGIVAVKYRGFFYLFAFYSLDLLVKIDILKNLLTKLFENDCNIKSLELIKWNGKINVIITLGTRHINYMKALTKLEEEELLLSSVLKANKISYRKLEDPFSLELAYLGPILFNDYFHQGIIKNYQLTPINFAEINENKSKLIHDGNTHVIFLIRRIDREIFEREKQRLLEELKNSLSLNNENSMTAIALMTLTSKEDLEEPLGIGDIKEKLQKIKEMEAKGVWYVDTFVFEPSPEETAGIPIPFILRKVAYQKVKDSHLISEDIQNAAISLLNSLSSVDTTTSSRKS